MIHDASRPAPCSYVPWVQRKQRICAMLLHHAPCMQAYDKIRNKMQSKYGNVAHTENDWRSKTKFSWRG